MLINCFWPVCIDHNNKLVDPKGGLIVYAMENWETYSTFDFPGCPYPSPYVNPPLFPAAFAFLTSCYQLKEKGT